ncbi:fasciclin domain-containing protein [Roseobacter weihaiensis]|uniref:fasciclin domain-containing protein n=1 Tax=Roseobacter weihaiensis TaxID=2763262 RepID=UPI001D0A6E33|nr:fasciclin domain-containing protein [Roseobacter sp. H9]
MNRRFALKATIAAGALATIAACGQTDPGNDIVDIAAANGNFNTLVAAIQAAGLEETLRGPGPFTVFAPTDAAFAALPEGTVENLLLPENQETLVSILTYHVVPGAIQSGDVLGQVQDVTTVNGQTVRVDGRGGKLAAAVRVNDANVTAADILASNGVIHVIDKVLLPD